MSKKENLKKKSNESSINSDGEVLNLPYSRIIVGLNPRNYFNEQTLNELAENIKSNGLIQPITVRQQGEMYQIICGERRYRACGIAGLETIRAIVRNVDDDEARDIAFSENLHRDDMLPMEEAEVIKYFIDVKKQDFKSLAIRMGMSEPQVRQRYSLNNLIEEVREILNKDEIQIGQAMLIATYEPEMQKDIYENHLKEHCNSQSWLNISYTRFQSNVAKNYTLSLLDAPFDKLECDTCIHNSALSQIFGDDKPKCQKSACFLKKKNDYYMNQAYDKINANPLYPIVHWCQHIPSWMVDFTESSQIKIIESYDWELYPETPKRPNPDKYITDGEVDKDAFDSALRDYEKEIADYNDELEDLKESIEKGEYINCHVYQDGILEIGYIPADALNEVEEEEEQEEDQQQEEENEENEEEPEAQSEQHIALPVAKPKRTFIIEKARIDSLRRQDEGFKDSCSEKIHKDIRELFESKPIEDKPLSESERQYTFAFMAFASDNCKERFFNENKNTVTLENMIEMSKLFSDEDRNFITREYNKSNLLAFSSRLGFGATLLDNFVTESFPAEAEEIKKKHEESYQKRKTKIDEEIKVLEDYIKDETEKDNQAEKA